MTQTNAAILVVDDERHVRSALCRVLRRMDFDAVEADGGEAALAAVAARTFACALVDLRMPGMDGLELIRRARRVDVALPCIVVTGHGDLEDAKRSAELGVADFVMKPWNNAELHLAILRAIQRRREAAAPPGGARAVTRTRPDAPRLAARVADALRAEEPPSPFAPPEAVVSARAWVHGVTALRALAQGDDADLAARVSVVAPHFARERTSPPSPSPAATDRAAAFALGLAAVWRMYEAAARGGEEEIGRAFRHARARAAVLRAAAEQLPAIRVDPLRAHLTGLFLDVGVLPIAAELRRKGIAWQEAADVASEHHAAASAWIAAAWGVPGEIVVACAQHHQNLPLYRAEPLLLLVWACEAAAAEVSGWAGAAPVPHGPSAGRLIGLSRPLEIEVEHACRRDSRELDELLDGPAGAHVERVGRVA